VVRDVVSTTTGVRIWGCGAQASVPSMARIENRFTADFG
jgi:hypothetical protein